MVASSGAHGFRKLTFAPCIIGPPAQGLLFELLSHFVTVSAGNILSLFFIGIENHVAFRGIGAFSNKLFFLHLYLQMHCLQVLFCFCKHRFLISNCFFAIGFSRPFCFLCIDLCVLVMYNFVVAYSAER